MAKALALPIKLHGNDTESAQKKRQVIPEACNSVALH